MLALVDAQDLVDRRFGGVAPFEAEPGIVTVDVLNRLMKENPTNMTQAIREWMNKNRPS